MAVLQALKVDPNGMYNDVAKKYMDGLVSGFNSADTIVEVFDRYDIEDSVKSFERARRESTGASSRKYEVFGGHTIPPWDKFI